MAIYIDSSLILSLILEDSQYEKAYNTWDKNDPKVASDLIKIESIITLKRFYLLTQVKKNKSWLNDKTKLLNSLLKEINLLSINEDVFLEVFERDELSQCKSLDAIHIATALIFKKFLNEKLYIGSFDDKFRKVCNQLKFECI